MQIAIAKPYIGEEEKQAVVAILESGQLTQGARVAEFEQHFAAWHGAKHGIATSNGTTALMASIMAHNIGPGDEVILPAFSFFATASSVMSTGATPVFADIDPRTFCMSLEATAALITARTKAIMPVHLFGHPADMPGFAALCEAHGLILLEDAAQAHGATLNGRSIGSWGTASFSFYPTKNITTTEGGMVLTNDDEIARLVRMIRNQGMNTQYHHEILGYNFRMTDMAAAIGMIQLGRLAEWTQRRRDNAAYYNANLTTVQNPFVEPGYGHVYHQYTVLVPEPLERDAVLKQLHDAGIGARVYYPTPIHKQPVIQDNPIYNEVHLPETEKACQRVISLPVHPLLTQEERAYIVEKVNAVH